jgi:hypothetical protein
MYIPESNIIETGYAQPNQFVLFSNNQPYTGFYHKDNKNRYWSGKTHTNTSLKLFPLIQTKTPSLNDFIKKSHISYGFTKHYDIPSAPTLYKGDYIEPTENDYNNGYFTRYVIKLKSSKLPYIIEINFDNYNKLTRTSDKFYYDTVQMLWKLTGPVDDIFEGNIRTIAGVRDTNLRSLQEAEKTIPGVSRIFTDPLQFY